MTPQERNEKGIRGDKGAKAWTKYYFIIIPTPLP
jgi:hypothetical protein